MHTLGALLTYPAQPHAQVPEGATAHSAPAALLAFIAALPRPLMPPAAMQARRQGSGF